MDWLTFFSSIIKSLAWPIALIVTLILLRVQVRGVVHTLGTQLQSFKGFGIETTFGEAVDQVEELLPAPEIKEITASFAGSGRLEGDAAQRIDTIATLVQLPPAYIVSQSWLRLEQAIREALDRRTLPGQRSRRLDYLRAARTEALLTDEEMPAVQRLREMRNLAAHSVDPPISMTDALRYQDMVDALITAIKQRAGK